MPMLSFASPLFQGRRARLVWTAVMLSCVMFSLIMALTPTSTVQMDIGWDKANHALAFAVLAVSGRFGLPPGRKAFAGLVIGLLAFGGLIELLQLHVPGRDGDWADLAADSVGITLGIVFAQLIRRLVRSD